MHTTPAASVPVAELGQGGGGGDESSVVRKRTIYVVEGPAVGCDREWDMGADGDDPAVGDGVRLRRVGGTIVEGPPGRKPRGRNGVCERRCRYLPLRLEARTAAPTERQRVPHGEQRRDVRPSQRGGSRSTIRAVPHSARQRQRDIRKARASERSRRSIRSSDCTTTHTSSTSGGTTRARKTRYSCGR